VEVDHNFIRKTIYQYFEKILDDYKESCNYFNIFDNKICFQSNCIILTYSMRRWGYEKIICFVISNYSYYGF
ncbi:MAG: hypothetical protein PWQ45_1510, partial [Thermosipho sp. (in: thermotogales)]|nr:hypothetical protein [Thermosipho sp. (in: thermotogales)]